MQIEVIKAFLKSASEKNLMGDLIFHKAKVRVEFKVNIIVRGKLGDT